MAVMAALLLLYNLVSLLFAECGRLIIAAHQRKLGINLSTLMRWLKALYGDEVDEYRRNGSSLLIGHRLSDEDRQCIFHTCNQTEYLSPPLGQIVPAFENQGLFISFYKAYVVFHE